MKKMKDMNKIKDMANNIEVLAKKITIEELLNKIDGVKREINLEKANGNLSMFINLNDEFDEKYDSFFNEIKADLINGIEEYEDCDWYEEEVKEIESWSNNELLEMLDIGLLVEYIDFLTNYLEELKEELKE